MLIRSVSVLLVINPVAIVDITSIVNESSFPVCFVLTPEAFIDRTVVGNQLALSISHVSLSIPLAIVHVTVFVCVLSCDSLDTVLSLFRELIWPKFFVNLLRI